jgi:hypothetical protein
MLVPAEFYKMAANFGQDLFVARDADIRWARLVLWNLTEEELKSLKAYLSELISDRYSDEQLQNLWAQMPVEIGFSPGLRTVLTMVRDQIR